MLKKLLKLNCDYARNDDDLYIVEFPKSGVTWLTNILSNVIYAENGLNIETNFFNVGDIICDVHTQKQVFKRKLNFPGYQIYKSHEHFRPTYKKIIYLWRDPKQCLLSYYRMLVGLREYSGTFSDFVRHPDYGIDAWCSHVDSWIYKSSLQQRMIFIEYQALKDNCLPVITDLVSNLGWNVKEDIIQSAIDKSSMRNMSDHEAQRFANDPRWSVRVSNKYRFVGNKMSVEISKSDEIFIGEKSNVLLEVLAKHEV